MLILLIAAVAGWLYFAKSEDEDLFRAIPVDAVYVIETNDLTRGWTTLSSSKQWTHLLSNEYFAFVNEDAQWMDSLIRNNKMLSRLMQGRRLLISAHMIPGNDYDFLFAVDLKSAARLGVVTDLLTGTLELADTEIRKEKILGHDVLLVRTVGDDDILYLAFSGNKLISSYNLQILESSLRHLDAANLSGQTDFVAMRDNLNQNSLFRIYFNYKMLDPFMRVFFSKPDPMAKSAGETLLFSGFEVKLKDERLRLDGFTLTDSMASYVRALSMVKPGRSNVERVLSERSAFYLSMSFDSYPEFFTSLREELRREDSASEALYDKNLQRLRRYFRIDLERDLFSWIGNEIAYVKMQPSADIKEKDFVVALHAGNIDKAKEGMGQIVKKVSNRTPWKVKDLMYGNHEIKYFQMKGFFKLFFGKLFEKLDEPYFIFLDDYVVFSNSPTPLIDMIDDYEQGKVLERDVSFMDFREDFNAKSNVNIFVRTPKVYSHLLYFATPDKKQGIESNQSLLLSYSRIGIQLVSHQGQFRTLLLADHEPVSSLDAEWERIEASAEESFSEEYELLRFKPELDETDIAVDGFIRKHYDDGQLRAEGLILNSSPSGLWRTFYPSGNPHSAVTYLNGMAHGAAFFYYDDQEVLKKAEVLFDNDVINGAYREFYRNGNPKALIIYREGLPDGDAEYYYESGAIKISGRFEKGEKAGRWKYYSEAGNVIEKERVRR